MDTYRKLWDLLVSIVAVRCFLLYAAAARCTFPAEWRGRWYGGGGAGEINIREHSMTQKGVCRAAIGDFYILENRVRGCTLCLLMMLRHKNVIQYKEGYCAQEETTNQKVCDRIQVEDPLFTLVREGSAPVQCPFQDSYIFTYNNNSGGFCREPISFVRPCASESKFSFHFQRCFDVFHSYERDLKFECVATWKDGSDTYIYGDFTGPGVISRDDRYRCFLYQPLGTDVNMAMSADASCRGLETPMKGPMVIQFQRDPDAASWQTPGCDFPAWIGPEYWEDLQQSHRYHLDPEGKVLRMDYRRQRQGRWRTQTAFRCRNIISGYYSNTEFTALTHTSHGCTTARHCLRITRRHDDFLEIMQGHVKEQMDEDCTNKDFMNSTRHLVLPSTLGRATCPMMGRFQLNSPSFTHCMAHFHGGCNGSHIMGLESDCPRMPGRIFECLKTWTEAGMKYVITRMLSDRGLEVVASCFIVEEKGDSVYFYTDSKCSGSTPIFFGESLRYVFKKPPARCEDISYIVRDEGKTVPQTGSEVTTTPLAEAVADTLSGSALRQTQPSSVICLIIIGCVIQNGLYMR